MRYSSRFCCLHCLFRSISSSIDYPAAWYGRKLAHEQRSFFVRTRILDSQIVTMHDTWSHNIENTFTVPKSEVHLVWMDRGIAQLRCGESGERES